MDLSCNGKRVRRSTETEDRKLANKIHAKVQTQIAEGKWLDVDMGKHTTLKELMQKYLKEHSPKKAANSAKRDKSSSKHLLLFFGGYVLADIAPRLISDYKGQRYREGAKPATINRELSLMKHAFTMATKEWELARENPVKLVSMEKEDNERDRWLDRDEERKLLEHCSKWLVEIIVFALNTGMRLEEILSLRWKQVDLSRRVVEVIRTKNKKKRSIPLNQTVLGLLKERSRVRYLASDCVFTSTAGTKIDQGNLRRAFIQARKKAGLGDFRFHDLRHTFATRLVQAGIDLYKVQKLLGHKTPQMTQRYSHHYPESLRDGVEALDYVTITSQSGENQEKGATGKPVTP